MPATFATGTDSRDWLPESSNVVAAIKNIKDRAVFSGQEGAKKLLMKSAKDNFSGRELQLLLDLLGSSPWTQVGNAELADFNLDPNYPDPLNLAILDEEELVEKVTNRRSSQLEIGESYQHAFERKVAPYLPFCQSVVIADPHAGAAFLDGNTEFVQNLLQFHHLNLEVVTGIPKRLRGYAPNEAGKKVAERFYESIDGYENFFGAASISVLIPNSKIFHSRRLGLKFMQGGFGLILDNSIGNFRDRVREKLMWNPISLAEFRGHLKAVRQVLKLSHDEQRWFDESKKGT